MAAHKMAAPLKLNFMRIFVQSQRSYRISRFNLFCRQKKCLSEKKSVRKYASHTKYQQSDESGLEKFLGSYAQFVAGVGIAALGLAMYLPESYLQAKYRKFAAAYKDGVEVPVEKELKEMAEKTLHDLKLPPYKEAGVEFFTCFSPDPVVKGAMTANPGVLIGLPQHFSNRTVRDVDKQKLMIGTSAIDWEKGEAQNLLKSLVLSDDAKKFVVLRELYYADSYRVHVKSMMAMTYGSLAYTIGFALNRGLGLRYRVGRGVRGVVFSLISAVCGAFYVLSHDAYNVYLDNKVDKRCMEGDENLVGGGFEYYSKVLQRNIATRALLGPDGAKLFTHYGNNVELWRSSRAPATHRRDRFKKKLDELTQGGGV